MRAHYTSLFAAVAAVAVLTLAIFAAPAHPGAAASQLIHPSLETSRSVVARGAARAVASQVVYILDDHPGLEWHEPITTTAPSGETFLGPFGSGIQILSLENLPQHTQAMIAFDLYILGTWDGNQDFWPPASALPAGSGTAPAGRVGPDIWEIGVDSDAAWISTSFSNWTQLGFTQSFPKSWDQGHYPAQTAAVAINSLGYRFYDLPLDSTYHLSLILDHQVQWMTIFFGNGNLQPLEDEAWGLDNLVVSVINDGSFDPLKVYLPLLTR